MIINSLKFVQGSVARKDFIPELNHFYIGGGTIKGYNGKLSLCAPLGLDIEAAPKATPFIKAIQACKDEEVSLSLTPGGRLAVRAGRFKAFIDCVELEAFPTVAPEGDIVPTPDNLLQIIKILYPFTAEDASRPWARGILFREHAAYATNNVMLIEHKFSSDLPKPINIPHTALAELIRIGQEPISLQLSNNSCTFHYEDGSWLYTLTSSIEWPNIEQVLNSCVGEPKPFPPDFFSAVHEALPFAERIAAIYVSQNQISTITEEGEPGAIIQVPGLDAPEGCFNGHYLLKLDGVAEAVDFSLYPKPCPFVGPNLRGAFAGMRK